jgi:hypothetical protein
MDRPLINNTRWTVRRSTVSGVQPIPPTSAQTYTDVFDNTWENNMTMEGELFGNIADNKLWWMASGGTPILIGSISGATEFVDLSDTPSDLAPGAGMLMGVNSGGTAIEFVEISTILDSLTSTTFTSLTDVPSSYSGEAGKYLRVNSGETGIEFTDVLTSSLTGSTDFEGGDYTEGNVIIGTGTGFSALTPSDYFVMTSGVQNVWGVKTFDDGIVVNSIQFSGITETITIDNITSNLSASSYTSLATSQAIVDYIDEQIFSTGSSANFVTLNTPQTITAEKTFTTDTNFNAINLSGNANFALSTVNYFGDDSTIGSYRERINEDGYFVLEELTATGWILKYSSAFSTSAISLSVLTTAVDQTIEGEKTFEGTKTVFNNPIELNNYFYLGDATTDGTWRFYVGINGLTYERRESGTYVWKYSITA